MDFILLNWEWFLLAFMVAEKIVKVTPVKWDDILVDGIKEGLTKLITPPPKD